VPPRVSRPLVSGGGWLEFWFGCDHSRGFREEGVVDDAGDEAANDGSGPKEPELTERPSVHEERLAGAAGGVHGGVRHGNADEVNEGEAESDGDAGERLRRARVRCAENNDQEEHRQNDFRYEAGEQRVSAGGMRAVSVGSEAAEDESGLAAGDDVEDGGAGSCSEHLGDDVGQKMRDGEAASGDEPNGDGGIEMAAGDVADGIAHRHDGE